MMPNTTNLMRLPGVERPTQPLLTTSTGSPMMVEDSPQLLPPLLFRDKSTQLRTASPTSHHTPKETTHGMMLSTTNPTRLPGVKRPTQPLLTTSTGSQMMEEDSPQLLHQLLLSKNGFHSMITNQLSLNMSKEMMLGQTIKQTNQMKLNGKLTFLPLVLIILTQLRPPQRPLLQMLTHLLLWFKRTALLIQ